MNVKLIALDIDGTLLDSSSQLPEANLRALAMADERGIEAVSYTHLDVYKRQHSNIGVRAHCGRAIYCESRGI